VTVGSLPGGRRRVLTQSGSPAGVKAPPGGCRQYLDCHGIMVWSAAGGAPAVLSL